MRSQKTLKVEKIGQKTQISNITAKERDYNPWDSGPTPVARGGCSAEAPPLAARTKNALKQPLTFVRRAWLGVDAMET